MSVREKEREKKVCVREKEREKERFANKCPVLDG